MIGVSVFEPPVEPLPWWRNRNGVAWTTGRAASTTPSGRCSCGRTPPTPSVTWGASRRRRPPPRGGVDRFCFHHLEYGGRGAEIVDADLPPERKRAAVKRLRDLTRSYHEAGAEIETLPVGNYADAAHLVEYARRHFGESAAERVADVDYQGNVHLTRFWQGYSLGNVRDRPFGAIWEDDANPLFRRLRERTEHLTGRCARCRYRDLCRGASRLRALAVTDDLFAPDPQCYLREEQIAPPAASGGD